MSFPDSNFERSGPDAQRAQDIVPLTERNQDAEITEAMRELTGDVARPLSEDERKAADRSAAGGERVYAPASERVPVDAVPGHRELTEHTDTHTPEREAAGPTSGGSEEPSFTRVARPSVNQAGDTYSPGAYGSTPSHDPSASRTPGAPNDAMWNGGARSGGGTPFGAVGIVVGLVGAAVCGWLYVRWRRNRNKPINRIRRQARQAASEIRERVPSTPEEAARPAAGLTTALLSILLILWQQAQARSRRPDARAVAQQGKQAGKRAADKAVSRASAAVADVDWQKRLASLKQRWDPSRVELEKISISRR